MGRMATRGIARGTQALLVRLTLCLTMAPLACVAGAPDRPGGVPEPPAPLPEIQSAPPTPGMVWVPGAWHWDGVTHVWLPGRWESPPPTP